ncbi:MAG: bifunctional precorrin-2 dehydrogenase/sirohydrochlorin ferrochelatase [bacterium]
MKYYPVFLNLRGKKCVVIGGGRVAERKIRQILAARGDVTVISPELTPGLKRLSRENKIHHIARQYRRGDTRNAFLVIAATADDQVNRTVSREFHGLLNVVDMPDYCTFIMPSVVSRGPLSLAISTSGVSPALSRTIRKGLDAFIPEDVSRYLSYLRTVRKKILRSSPGSDEKTFRKRSLLLKRLGSPEILQMLKDKGFKATKTHLERIVRETGL